MTKLFSILSLLFILPVWVKAAEPTDLGYNLSYLRVRSLSDAATALPSTLSAKHAFVLDLRYTTASQESVSALQTALSAHPADAPLFVLVSPATPSGIIDALMATSGGLITLGIAGSQPSPNIAIKAEAETDRLAYEAFDNGTPLAELISGKITKDRYDEATLVQEFKNGNSEPEPPLAPDPTKPKIAAGADKTGTAVAIAAAPLKDLVLQRALNLYQALQALRR